MILTVVIGIWYMQFTGGLKTEWAMSLYIFSAATSRWYLYSAV